MYGATRAAGFGAEVKRRIMLGTYVLSAGYYDAYYLKAQQVRTLIRRDFDAAFAALRRAGHARRPTTAFRLGEKTDDPLTMYLSDIFTISVNLAGLPGWSFPAASTRRACRSASSSSAGRSTRRRCSAPGATYEQATDWHRRRADRCDP